jgi:flagellin-specific chaperone FliS
MKGLENLLDYDAAKCKEDEITNLIKYLKKRLIKAGLKIASGRAEKKTLEQLTDMLMNGFD